MNPWDVVSWIGAVAVAVLIVAFTGLVVMSIVRGSRKRSVDERFASIVRDRGGRR